MIDWHVKYDDCPESSTDHYYSPQFLETSLFVRHEGFLNITGVRKGKKIFGGEMDQLEAELEVSEKSEDLEGTRFIHDHLRNNKDCVLVSWRQGYTSSWRQEKKGEKRVADGIGSL
ncbi:LOW QUALITY PROTEIN: hypothetical protein HID58_055129 [Brassica napus]|uniref:Uncharacterized protein n=1 Tax=Brassica napus TaxID=3708 RepID=A0ABQ8AJL6_BRANA|nr:LOW QUALITY PROTEIN: hypothetical protein HID58_055129 [Brassica napus]